MQIPATSSASQAASIAAQATSKDGSSDARGINAQAQLTNQAIVEKSNEASADRDAQGQGDGLPRDGKPQIVDELEIGSGETAGDQTAPQLPDQPPSELDIVG